jgi:exo-beta-1,3-glucanase (GH17 family)
VRDNRIRFISSSILYIIMVLFFTSTVIFCNSRDEKKKDIQNNNIPASDLKNLLENLCWAAYSPSGDWDPIKGIYPKEDSILQDLILLRKAGFSGIVTYGANQIPNVTLVEQAGLKGIIYGIWDPNNKEELEEGIKAAKYDVVIGFCIGNEGLFENSENGGYTLDELKESMQYIREKTGKPVTTTEQIRDYTVKEWELLEISDWIFCNTHPYFENIKDPVDAVDWTKHRYNLLKKEISKPIIFKEVGFPSAGDPNMSEKKQLQYYQLLLDTDVNFVWFESFDQRWKTYLPIESHWGLFKNDRSPKEVVNCICGRQGD